MKTTRKALSILLAVLMLMATLAVAAVPAQAYSTIQFGNYPQTRVRETTALKNAAEAATWASYEYYIGTDEKDGQMQPGDWMQYADFFSGGVKYRAVKFTQYRPFHTYYTSSADNSFQDNNGYSLNTTYYFKYEPLTWRVLDPSTGLVLCESTIDAQAYQNEIWKNSIDLMYYIGVTGPTYANNYAESTIRTWLNNDFYNTAFNGAQKANIKSTTITNAAYSSSYSQYNAVSTTDEIFLLSYSETKNSGYGFSSDSARQAKGTDYAKCQGLMEYSGGFAAWWLRSAAEDGGYACKMGPSGYLSSTDSVSYTGNGIRPACCLTNLESDISVFDTYTIAVQADPVNGGTVTGDGTYAPGTRVELTATAKPGYYFYGWYKGNDRVSGNSDYSFDLNEDVSLTVKFECDKNLVNLKIGNKDLQNGNWYFDFSAWVDYMVTLYDLEPSSQEEAEEFFGQAFINGNTLKYDPESRTLVFLIANDDGTTTVDVLTSGDEEYTAYKPFVKQYKDTGTPDQPDNPGGGNDQPTNTNPDNGGQSQGKVCKYCGEVHTGFPGVLIGFFHSILALFGLHK